MSTQLETILSASKKLESLLTSLGAHGRGLHEKCSSLEHLLPADVIYSIRMVASTRNKAVHEDGFELSDIGSFQYQAGSAIAYLEKVMTLDEEPKGTGITVTPLKKIFHEVPIEEMEWFLAQPPLFPSPNKEPRE